MRFERRGGEEERRSGGEEAGIERDVGKETESECLVILQFVPKGFVRPPAPVRKSAYAVVYRQSEILYLCVCVLRKASTGRRQYSRHALALLPAPLAPSASERERERTRVAL